MTDTQNDAPYATPIQVDGPENCQFYHTVDLPGLGEISASWDLRNCVDDYLGQVDYSGQRVLDVGTASGYLSFEMEKRGAEVVSFDMDMGTNWNVVPYPWYMKDIETRRTRLIESTKRLHNSYWLSHRLLNSKARAYYGNIYEPLPSELGSFDIAFFGMIFTHLRDPFAALASMLQSVTGRVVVTNHFLNDDRPIAAFVPSTANLAQRAFWMPSKGCITNMLGVLGFEVERFVPCDPICTVENYDTSGCSAVVAKRAAG